MKRILFIVCIVLALALGASALFIGNEKSAEAGLGHNIRGWAWSDTIGWISLNSINPGAVSSINFGVNLDNNKKLSGYGWSDNVGWVTFNESQLNGCPKAPCKAYVDGDDLKGWAKVLSADGNGWDGWLSLGSQTGDSVVYGTDTNTIYGVTTPSTPPSGTQAFSWGNSVMGWTFFSFADSGVVDCTTNPTDPACDPKFNSITASCLNENVSGEGRVRVIADAATSQSSINYDFYQGTSPTSLTLQYSSGQGFPMSRFWDHWAPNNTTYFYKVRATNAGGVSVDSQTISASCTNACIPNDWQCGSWGSWSVSDSVWASCTTGQTRSRSRSCSDVNSGTCGVSNPYNTTETQTCSAGAVSKPEVGFSVAQFGRSNFGSGPITVTISDTTKEVTLRSNVITKTPGAVTTCTRTTVPTSGGVGSSDWNGTYTPVNNTNEDISTDLMSPTGRTFTLSLSCRSSLNGNVSEAETKSVRVEANKANPF